MKKSIPDSPITETRLKNVEELKAVYAHHKLTGCRGSAEKDWEWATEHGGHFVWRTQNGKTSLAMDDAMVQALIAEQKN
jgi:hypothetical protein